MFNLFTSGLFWYRVEDSSGFQICSGTVISKSINPPVANIHEAIKRKHNLSGNETCIVLNMLRPFVPMH